MADGRAKCNLAIMEAERTHVLSVVQQTVHSLDQSQTSNDRSHLILRLEYLNRAIVNNGNLPDSIVSNIAQAIDLLKEEDSKHFCANKIYSGRAGRPSFDIKEEQLDFLVENGFTVPQISQMLRVSKRTVERRMASFGISISGTYSDINDDELDVLVRGIQQQHPGVGIRLLKGHLLGQGHRLQRERLRQSLLRTDPTGVLQRWRESIRRRVYSVVSPQALWHIDGNHKLIRWRIVVHAGVDGYTRMPVFINASNNNYAETVLNLFKDAVRTYGLPSRVRCDKGGENFDVGWFMLNHPQRGPGRGCVIAGKSTHNQRIERLWRDVFQGCLFLFYDLFNHLEGCGLLDPNNDVHLWCLHYVYLPMINKHLVNWKNAWSHHPLRTERNRSPLQLWIQGVHSSNGRALEADTTLSDEEIQDYGIDWQGPVPEQGDESNTVEVPETPCRLTEVQLLSLRAITLGNDVNDPYRIELFSRIVREVETILH